MQYNLADLWEQVVATAPEREALVCGERRLTYAEADERANRLAHHLADQGVGAGDHVALYLYNGTEYLEGMLAAFKLRAVPVNVNYRYVEEELRYLLDDADAKAVVFHREFAPKLDAVRETLPLLRTIVAVDDGSAADLDALGGVPRSWFRATFRRRSLHPLHRRHDGDAKGRDVAGRGHLLRRARRRRDRQRDHPARGDRRSRSRRTHPLPARVPLHARNRPLD